MLVLGFQKIYIIISYLSWVPKQSSNEQIEIFEGSWMFQRYHFFGYIYPWASKYLLRRCLDGMFLGSGYLQPQGGIYSEKTTSGFYPSYTFHIEAIELLYLYHRHVHRVLK